MHHIFSILLLFCSPSLLGQAAVTERTLQEMAKKIFLGLGGTGNCPVVRIGPNNDRASIKNDIIVISDELVVKKLTEKYKNNPALLDDAFAIIIGHELWHYIKGEKMGGLGYIGQYGEHAQSEYEADLHGLFGALLFPEYANASKIMPDVYGLVLPDKHVQGYPIMSVRKQTHDTLIKRVMVNLQFFDIGAGFLLRQQGTEDFEIARTCYQIVAEDLASIPDVQYNLGMTYLLQALYECEFKYLLPAEINSGSFAQAIRGPRAQDHNGKDVTDLLTKAEAHFDQANKQQGKRYYDAFIAKYCIQTVRSKQGENTGILKKWLNENRTVSIEHYKKMQLIYAVALLRKGERDTAVNLLDSLAGTNDIIGSFASINLKKVGPQKPEKYEDRKPIRWDIVRDAQKLENLDSKQNWVVINKQFSYLIEEGQIKSVRYGYGNILGIDAVMAEPSWPQKGVYQTGSGAYGHLTGAQGETTSCDFFFKTNNSGGIQAAWRIFYYRK